MAPPKKVSDAQLAEDVKAGLTQAQILRKHKITLGSNISLRIKQIAKDMGVMAAKGHTAPTSEEMDAERRINEYMRSHGRRHMRCDNGKVLVFGDAHYMPGVQTTAHRAFLWACKELRPSAVINNGDSLDGASISRWPRIGWDSRPTVIDELKVCTERLQEIEETAGTKNLYWNLGNHDARFETFLASRAPEYEGVKGFCLKDHFPTWLPSWSVWINDDVVVKHRWKGGIHATRNNALNAGKTVVTGHLHSLKVTPVSDYNGTRFGVDVGTLAQPYGSQFVDYTEDNPVDWRSGFAVLTFWDGMLLWPEVVHVVDEEQGLIQFRGEIVSV
jgi:hypothetical protein